MRRKRKQAEPTELATARTNLAEVRTLTTAVTRIDAPDQYSHLDTAHPTVQPDRETFLTTVRIAVEAALANSSVDEFAADFLDRQIDAIHAGWDSAIDRHQGKSTDIARALAAYASPHLTAVLTQIAEVNYRVTTQRALVDGWRDVLLGATDRAPLVPARPADVTHDVAELILSAPLLRLVDHADKPPTTQAGNEDFPDPKIAYLR